MLNLYLRVGLYLIAVNVAGYWADWIVGMVKCYPEQRLLLQSVDNSYVFRDYLTAVDFHVLHSVRFCYCLAYFDFPQAFRADVVATAAVH